MALPLRKDPQDDLKRFGRRCVLGVGAFVTLAAVLAYRRRDANAGSTLFRGCGKSREPNTGPIVWVEDIEVAASFSRVEKKHIIVVVGATWDTGTSLFSRETFVDPDVRAIINEHYIALWVDASDDEEPRTRAALDRFYITGVPTIILFTPNYEREIKRVTSYVRARELLPMLLYAPEQAKI